MNVRQINILLHHFIKPAFIAEQFDELFSDFYIHWRKPGDT